MIAFGVIVFLILTLAFIITRNQSVQREFKQTYNEKKTLQSENKYALGVIMMMGTELQKTFTTKLASLKSHGLINQKDFDVASFVLENFQYVIVQCCQHNETVEVALSKALKGSELTMEQISQFVARQPSETRIPWCKNTIDGFVAACRNLASQKIKTTPKTDDSSD